MRSALPGGELEETVLADLWDHGAAAVRAVHERVGVPRGLAYTTIATVLDRLRGKRLVARKRSGKAFVYHTRIGRDALERARAKDAVARILRDRPSVAMAGLVD